MSINPELKKTGLRWEFKSEQDLEFLLCENLNNLLGLTVLSQQYNTVARQICDNIIAVDNNKQLVLLELKNTEDRYIIQQLTRYYDAILQEKPFCDRIDYNKPVRLIAISPSFHRDNFTDRKYCQLNFQFLEFKISEKDDRFTLKLKDTDTGKNTKIAIPYRDRKREHHIPSLPKLLNIALTKRSNQTRERILAIRKQILSCDDRIKEVYNNSSVKYGKGNKLCAKFRYDRKQDYLAMFLWLPLISRREITGRTLVRTKDWVSFTYLFHVIKGFSRSGKRRVDFTKYSNFIKWKKNIKIKDKKIIFYSIDYLVEFALHIWHKKISK